MKTSSIFNITDINKQKESMYYFREWIAEYKDKILTDSNVSLEIGSIHDSPRILSKDIV